MIKTQVYLPKSLLQSIDLLAKRREKTRAQIIRDALKEKVDEIFKKKRLPTSGIKGQIDKFFKICRNKENFYGNSTRKV